MNSKILFFFSFCIVLSGIFYSCSKDDIFGIDSPDFFEDEETVESPTIPEDSGDSGDDDLNLNTQNVSYDDAISIVFSSNGVNIDNPFENAGVSIESNDGHVTINASLSDRQLYYILSGSTSDGSVKIYGTKKIGLVFNGVEITNPKGAAINVQNKKKCEVTIVDQTNNRLIDGSEYVFTDGEDMKATFFSEGNTEISGNGNLEIRGKYKHALCIDGSLLVSSGTIHVKEAASDGIHTNDEIQFNGGNITIRSAGDAIDCESETEPISITGGEINITTTGSKGHAIKAGQDISIDTGGSVDITVYGTASKGIKPTGNLTITRGDITINTAGNAIWDSDENDTSSAAGIKCDGNFLMENGTLTILSAGSGGKGINTDGTFTLNNGTVSVTTTGAQYVYSNRYSASAKAIKSDGNLTINGGNVTIRTSRTEAEGIESKATLSITGGEIDIIAYDDGINASKHIQIDGGQIYCRSTSNDAIDSNGTLTITGGTVIAVGATSPEGGFDCDNNRFTISGGTIIGVGASTSTPTSSSCTQRSVIFNTSGSNIQIIRIETTSGGNEVLTFKSPRTYSSLSMLFSSPSLNASTGYTIYTGGEISGGSSFHGLYTGATYKQGSTAGSFTTGSAAGSVTTIGNSNQMGGGGPGWR